MFGWFYCGTVAALVAACRICLRNATRMPAHAALPRLRNTAWHRAPAPPALQPCVPLRITAVAARRAYAPRRAATCPHAADATHTASPRCGVWFGSAVFTPATLGE